MSRTEIVSSTPLTNPDNEDLRAALALDDGKIGNNCIDLMHGTEQGTDLAAEAVHELFPWNRTIHKRDQAGHLYLDANGLLVSIGEQRVEHPMSADFMDAYLAGDHAEMGRIVSALMNAGYRKAAEDAVYDLPEDEACDEDEQADIAFRIARDMEDAA